MSNSRDFTNNNTIFTGTDGITVPIGTSAQRTGTQEGKLRYNSDTGLGEFYTAGGWVPIDAPPAVTGISGTVNENTSSTLTVNGTNFKNGAIVSIEGAGVGGIPRTLVTTFVNSAQLTAATNASSVNFVGGASYDVKVTNPSGLAGSLVAAASIDRDPLWSTASGSLGTVADSARSSTNFTLSASDPDGSSVTYGIESGSLPSGVSLNTSTGAITGTYSAVSSNTTSNFTISATSNGQSVNRSFSITVNAPVITFATASGSIGTIYDGSRSNLILSPVTATASSGTVSYSIVSGGIPSGLSFNTSSGAITGTANAVGSDTTSNFTVRATTSSASATADRAFSITVRAPIVTSFTSTGTTSFSIPTGVNAAQVVVVAGGGAGGTRNGGVGGGTDGGAGGGAGGMIDVPGFSLTPGGSVTVTVGAGGPSNLGGEAQGQNGGNSVFGSLTAIGGGGGGAGPGGPVADGRPGGSGGGRGGGGSPNTGVTGSGVQPGQPGQSGSFGYGNRGGFNPNSPPFTGAGGGGAGAVGADGGSGQVGNGGSGRSSSIVGSPVFYAGGGGGGTGSSVGPGGTGAGGNGGGAQGGDNGDGNGRSATANRGGGGGGGAGSPAPNGGGGAGGPGIVIVRY
jgi:hypothetical protein